VRRVATVAAALVVTVLLSGCVLGDDDETQAGATTATTPTTTTTPRATARESQDAVRLVVVTHGEASDPFWAVVRNGVEQAARDLGADVSYRAADVYQPARMRQLIEAAVDERPDGLVVTLPDARALAPALRKAASSKIPVIAVNSGADVYRRLGALLYVGLPEFSTGVAAGRRLAAAGVRNAICVVHQAGVASLEQRCEGFAQGLAAFGGSSTVVEIELQQQQEAVGRLIGWIAGASPPVDGILAVGPAAATPALAALKRERAFGRVKLATFDLAPDILRALHSGEIQFAIDQQPYLQGYLPVVFLTQQARYGLMPSAGTTMRTGPTFVTKADVARVSRLTSQGIR
jgi:simple sugar transport system substrate-binding protein